MKIRNRMALFLFILILMPAMLYGSDEKSVLFISSYHPGFSTFFQQVEGLKDSLSPENIHLEVEFMDTKRLPEEKNYQLFRQYLEYKLANTGPYGLIITGDDNALTFALEEKDSLFQDLPIVFLGVNNVDKALEMNDISGITGIIEKVSMEETIDLILKNNPAVENIAVIIDSTPSGYGDLLTFWSLKELYPSVNFLNLDLRKSNWKQFSEILKSQNDDTAVLLLSAYSDCEEVTLDFSESLELITSSLNVPLYHLWEHGIGQGILGGKVISHVEQGRQAGKIAQRIIKGEDIDNIPVVDKSPNSYLLDYRIVKKFRIPEESLPPSATLLNEPYSFYRENSQIIIFTASMILFLMLTISYLLYLIFTLKQTELSLKKKNEQNSILLSAVEQLGDTVEIFDLDRKTTYVNSSFLKIHNLKKEEVLGKTSVEIFTDVPQENYEISDQLWADVETGKIWRGRFRNRTEEGAELIQDANVSPVFNEKGEIIAYSSVKKDVTESVKLLEERDSIQEHMYRNQKMESIGQLASGIANDFNNLLSGIMTSSQMLLRNLDKEEKIRKYGEMIHSSCKEGAEIVEKLMSFSQSRRSSPKDVEIENLVKDTMEILRHTIKKSIKIELINELDQETLFCDSYSLQNALLNMGVNSDQAIQNMGKITITISRRKLDEEYCSRSDFEISPGSYCAIALHDTGTGITNYALQKIFEPFYTGHTEKNSAGLGLTSVQRIVKEHRGCIEVETEIGQWTCFTLLLPFKAP